MNGKNLVSLGIKNENEIRMKRTFFCNNNHNNNNNSSSKRIFYCFSCHCQNGFDTIQPTKKYFNWLVVGARLVDRAVPSDTRDRGSNPVNNKFCLLSRYCTRK